MTHQSQPIGAFELSKNIGNTVTNAQLVNGSQSATNEVENATDGVINENEKNHF